MATGTPQEIEEERRLLYVAMTRARDDLYLMQAHRFHDTGPA
jgi:ATP-dependent DNA helicase UvrD/PcrA